MLLLVLALLAALGVLPLLLAVASDGRGWRPPPTSWADQDATRTWPR